MTYTPLTSTAFALKDLLLEGIRGLEDFAGVDVTYGWPGRSGDREWIFLGAITWSDEDWSKAGGRERQEDYEISLVINVQTPGASDQEVMEKAAGYMGVIERYIRSTPLPRVALGSPRALTVQLKPKSCGTFPAGDTAIECQFEASIVVMARL